MAPRRAARRGRKRAAETASAPAPKRARRPSKGAAAAPDSDDALAGLEIRDEDLKFSPLMLRQELTGLRHRAAAGADNDLARVSQAESEATEPAPDALPVPPRRGRGKQVDKAPEPVAVNDNIGSAGAGTPSAPEQALAPGLSVTVLPRPKKGNKSRDLLDGPGVIMGVSDDGALVDVKFVLGGRTKDVPREYVVTFDATGESALIAEAKRDSLGRRHSGEGMSKGQAASAQTSSALSPTHATASSDAYVRRSYRCKGKQQLRSSRVTKLLDRLWKNDPQDKTLQVLRLKNHIDANSNKQVILEVLEALEQNEVVQALYIQNMEEGMDDETLARLTEMLRANPRIWALNVGENFQISRAGWEQFAEDLAYTHVTHLYAGSETTVYGALKVRMRDVIRGNRIKHTRHKDPRNIGVIDQIGQMWWNPRNAKALQPHLPAEARARAARADPLVGRKVIVCFADGTRRLGRVVKFNEDHAAHLVAWSPAARSVKNAISGAWLRLHEHEVLVSGHMGWCRPKDIMVEKSGGRKGAAPKKEEKKAKKGPTQERSLKDACLDVWMAVASIPACNPFVMLSNKRKRSRNFEGPNDLITIRTKVNGLEYLKMADFAEDMRKFFRFEIDAGEASECVLTGVFASMSVAQLATELLDSFERELAPAMKDFKDVTQTYRPLSEKEATKADRYVPVQFFWALGQNAVTKDGKALCLFLSGNARDVVPVRRTVARPWRSMKPPAYISKELLEIAESEECLYCYSNNMLCQ